MFERFTNRAQEVIGEAKKAAAQLEQNYIGTEHLLLGLVRVSDSVASKLLQEQGVTEERLEELISSLITPTGSVSVREPDGFSPEAYRVIQSSYLEAKRFHSSLVGTEHILISMLKSFDCAGTKLLNTMKVNIRQLYIELVSAKDGDVAAAREDVESLQYTRNAESKTPLLDQYSTDLTELAKEGRIDPVIGREQEINRVIQILSRRTKNNPCLIGEPGVGKTAIAEGLASRIYEGNVPDTISGKRVVTLDMAGMVAGSKYRGEFEERMKNVINEVRNDGQTLLFIDELHTLVDAGGADGAMNASNILKPCLARGELQIVGATTIDEYRKHIEKDAALERRFQPVMVEEPSEDETVAILKGLRHVYEEHHRVKITDAAKDGKVLGATVMNITANMMGLGNAATPFGIKAMEEMDRLNTKKGVASNDMALFLVLNAACIQLVPSTVLSIRAAAGSTNPGAIILPAIISTGTAAIVGVICCKILQRYF